MKRKKEKKKKKENKENERKNEGLNKKKKERKVFSGMVNGLMLLFGFGGAVASGIVLDRTKLYAEITIYLFGGAAICAIVLLEFFLVPDQEAVILVFAILFGIFGEGLFPVGLELAVEATYPVEESITSAFIYLSGQIIGIVIIFIVPALAFERADQTMSICSTDGEYAPLDYTISITSSLGSSLD
ncbi:Uncharacterized protein Anas_14589 [Armadillidium nasatum]|uniref:Major facilitator superfamily (MFS) profile domain-containing protein n=1 Tax=Armadillidium nasatum TaxID=96803 RepID=A0A5N5T7H9_9CRUS|nr:Uncharacterized protein Anas_14589 [Armadillidium nasatum]